MRALRTYFSPEYLLLLLAFLTILWKGGKALDAVWLLSLVSVVLVFFVCTSRRSPETRLHIPVPLFLLTLLYIALTCVSFAFSTTQNYGLDEVFQTVALGLIFLLTIAVFHTHEFKHRFAKVMSLALLLSLLIGFVVYVYQPVSRFVGTFFDYRFHTDYWPNAWGEFFLLAWPLLLWSLFLRRRCSVRELILSSCVLGISFGGFFLSYSRGSFIAFAGQLTLMFFLSIYHYRSAFAWKKVVSVGVLSLLVSLMTFTGFNHLRSRHFAVESVMKKATFQSSEGASSINERQIFFAQSLELIRFRPLLGYGPYAFRFIQPHVQNGVLETSDHPHNVVLKHALERGVVTGLIFLLIILFSLVPAVSAVFHRRHQTGDVLTIIFSVSILGVLAHNLIDYNLQFVGISLPFWVLLSFLARSRTDHTQKFDQKFLRLTLVTVSTFLLLFILLEGVFLAVSSFARHAEANGDRVTALQYYSYTDHSMFPRDAWLSRSALFLRDDEFISAENAVSHYIATNFADARGWRLLGDIYLAWDKKSDALRAYEKAYEYGKWNDAGIIRGLVYLLQSDRTKLTDRRHEIDALLNDYAYAIQHNEHFIALGNNVEEVVSLAELLATVFPADRTAYRALIDQVTEHALLERSKYSSRPSGFLW